MRSSWASEYPLFCHHGIMIHAQFEANYRDKLQLIWGNIAHALQVAI
jgi:hypothetical protein